MAKTQNKKFKSINEFQKYYVVDDKRKKERHNQYYKIGADSVKMALKNTS